MGFSERWCQGGGGVGVRGGCEAALVGLARGDEGRGVTGEFGCEDVEEGCHGECAVAAAEKR